MTVQVPLPFRVQPPAPFLKWAGGKRQLLGQLRPRIPSRFGRYFEPFVGAGALFFALRPEGALLADANERLIRTYLGVRNDPDGVIECLGGFRNDKTFFLGQRERDIDKASDTEVAAWMLYLNHTAYNGLYRVNRQGRFNVPFGRYNHPRICDPDNIRACSSALKTATITVADFEAAVEQAKPGDFVYFDPPYIPLSRYSDFSRYTSRGFSREDHVRLRDVATRLKREGVHVLVSNSDTDEVRVLYAGDFELAPVTATRFINSRAAGRGRISELLIS
jgi:DNA adenine methylase